VRLVAGRRAILTEGEAGADAPAFTVFVEHIPIVRDDGLGVARILQNISR
jgi:hypothetical protein